MRPAELHEIVRPVEALFALTDQIEARFRKAQAELGQLAPPLLARAFRGQVVPQTAPTNRRLNSSTA